MTTLEKSAPLTVNQANVMESIRSLPAGWNPDGSLNIQVIERLFQCALGASDTAETGCGRSTLALSHASKRHVVFACEVPSGRDSETHSLNRVRQSELLNRDHCEFTIGPTQLTLPRFQFDRQFDLVLIDGPHGYPFPDLEYYYFYPHIKPGGWLVVDDIQIPTVANMVDVLKADDMFSLEFVVRSTAFFKRTDAPMFFPLGDGWFEQRYNKKRGVAIRHVAINSMPRLIAAELLRRLGRQ